MQPIFVVAEYMGDAPIGAGGHDPKFLRQRRQGT